jgi:uncharacterized protein YjbJ (UPF0337 family)
MNWDLIQGNWMQFKQGVRGNWVKLTDEDLTRIGGSRDELVARLQAHYGFSKNEAQREVDAWVDPALRRLKHDPEKWKSVFRKDHARQQMTSSRPALEAGRPVSASVDRAGPKAILQKHVPESRGRFALSASSLR